MNLGVNEMTHVEQSQPQKKKKWPWIVGGVIAIIIVGSVLTGSDNENAPTGPATPTITTQVAPPSLPSVMTTQAPRVVKVRYEVTGNARDANVMYTTYTGGGWSTSTEQRVRMPWSKDTETDGGFLSGGSLIVTTGLGGGSITCKVIIDGRETKTATASGQFASANCTGF